MLYDIVNNMCMSNEAIKHHMAYKISHWLYVYITVKCLPY